MIGKVSTRHWAVGFAVAIGIACTSCSSGDSLHPVHGQVKVNGQPAAGATVVFYREGQADKDFPTATVEEDGSFNLKTGGKPGAPAGNYTVTVVWPAVKKVGPKDRITMGSELTDGPDRLKGAYGTPEKSSIKVEIKSANNELNPFELK